MGTLTISCLFECKKQIFWVQGALLALDRAKKDTLMAGVKFTDIRMS